MEYSIGRKTREAKRTIARAKKEASDEWCEKQDSPEGKKDTFAWAKQLKKYIVVSFFMKHGARNKMT